MESYDCWITVYSCIYSILIITLSLNSIFFIKDKINKVLAFFAFTGLYSFILSYFFSYAYIGYIEQEPMARFIYEGFRSYLFFGNIYIVFSVFIFITLLIRLFINKIKKPLYK